MGKGLFITTLVRYNSARYVRIRPKNKVTLFDYAF